MGRFLAIRWPRWPSSLGSKRSGWKSSLEPGLAFASLCEFAAANAANSAAAVAVAADASAVAAASAGASAASPDFGSGSFVVVVFVVAIEQIGPNSPSNAPVPDVGGVQSHQIAWVRGGKHLRQASTHEETLSVS